jgi:hypothetical protein
VSNGSEHIRERPTITTEREANALRHGAVVLDRNGDAFQKVGETGWEMTGTSGRWSASWIAFPAFVLFAKPPYEDELAALATDAAQTLAELAERQAAPNGLEGVL